MSINLVRKNSDTPNIRNIDDARIMRYATYGKSGIIKDYGEEIALSQGASNILHIGTGEMIHQGWQVTIDGSGVDITLDNRDSVEYYTIYLEINLAIASNQTAQILSMKANNTYPIIDPGDDLTEVPSGTSRVEIGHIMLVPANSTFEITSLLEIIPYYPTYSTYAVNATNSEFADYASSDRTKGTIEQRLTNLGFKYPITTTYYPLQSNGVILGMIQVVMGYDRNPNESSRQGNRIYLRLVVNLNGGGSGSPIANLYNGTTYSSNTAIPVEYRPTRQQTFYIPSGRSHYRYSLAGADFDTYIYHPLKLTLETTGIFTISKYLNTTILGSLNSVESINQPLYIGFPANPITS